LFDLPVSDVVPTSFMYGHIGCVWIEGLGGGGRGGITFIFKLRTM